MAKIAGLRPLRVSRSILSKRSGFYVRQLQGVSPLKVLLVHNQGSPGTPSGEKVVLDADSEALRQLGVDVVRYEVSNDALRIGRFSQIGNAVDAIWSRSAHEKMLELLDHENPDVVHCHSVLPVLSAAVFDAARRRSVPTVQTLHNYRWLCVEGGLVRSGEQCLSCVTGTKLNGVRHRCSQGSVGASAVLSLNNRIWVASKRLSRLVNRFVAVSGFVKDVHVAAGFSPEQIVVKYNAVATRPKAVDRRAKVVLFAGRLSEAKGADLLPLLAAELPDFTIQIAGTGPLRSELERQSHMTSNLKVMGLLSGVELEEAMALASVVVVPSRFPEPFGLVAAEAMASGVPVVASGSGGLSELLEGSRGGIVVPLSSVAIARGVRAVAQTEKKAQGYGDAGRAFAREELSLERTGRQLLDVYESVV